MADDDLEEFFSDEEERKDEIMRNSREYSEWLESVIGPNGVGSYQTLTEFRSMPPHPASGMGADDWYRSLIRKPDLELLRKIHKIFVALSQQLQAKKIKSSIDGDVRPIGSEQRAMWLCQESMRRIIKANNLHSDWAKPHNISVLLYRAVEKK